MEGFFDREVKRLEYVGERRQLRNNQKKELDAAVAAKEQVIINFVCILYEACPIRSLHNEVTCLLQPTLYNSLIYIPVQCHYIHRKGSRILAHR